MQPHFLPPTSRKFIVFLFALFGLSLAMEQGARAHKLQVEPLVATIRPQDTYLTAEFTGNVQDVDQSIGIDINDSGKEKSGDGSYLPSAVTKTEKYFNERFILKQNDKQYVGTVQSLRHEPGLDPGASKFHLFIRYPKPDGVDANSPLTINTTLLDYLPNARIIVSLGGASKILTPGDSMEIDPSNLAVSLLTNVVEFAKLGAEHIFTGYDHMLFILALLLVATDLKTLVKTLTGFTIAHSITLCGTALGWFSFPPRVTEILIPVSIIYVGLENIFLPENKHRFWIASAFGLVHGFGFANNLRDMGMPGGAAQFWCLLSFNLGVEIAQVILCLIAFPLLMLWKKDVEKKQRKGSLEWPQIVRFASIAVVVAGGYFLTVYLLPSNG